MPPSRKRILHIYKDYWPPIVGGIEKTIHHLAHGCSDAYDVEVLVCSRDRSDKCRKDGAICVRQVGELGRFASAPLAPAFPLRLRQTRADILHFHHPNPTGELAYLLARHPGKIVVTYHSDIVRQKWSRKLYAPFLRRFLRKADVILPTSPNYIRSSRFLRPLAKRCKVAPLGVRVEDYALTPSRLETARRLRQRYGNPKTLLLFVGQFREYKGLPFLIQAMTQIQGDVIATLVGDGPCRTEVERLIQETGLTDRIFLPGRLSDEEIIAHYHACDLFVLPSHRRSEAFGIVQLEAMACGKPVISTRLNSGVPFVNRHEKTGLTVEPANPTALAKAIQTLAASPNLQQELGDTARQRTTTLFHTKQMIHRVKTIYQQLLKTP